MGQIPIGTARQILPESGKGQPLVVIEQDTIDFLRRIGIQLDTVC